MPTCSWEQPQLPQPVGARMKTVTQTTPTPQQGSFYCCGLSSLKPAGQGLTRLLQCLAALWLSAGSAVGTHARPRGEQGREQLPELPPPFLRIMKNRNTILGLRGVPNDPTVVTDLMLSAADPKLRRLLVGDDDFCAHE